MAFPPHAQPTPVKRITLIFSRPLPAITGSIYLQPDGWFPHHTPNPEDKRAVEATREAVLAQGADLGVMFDTDVDRSGVVDRTGKGKYE